MSVSLVCPPTYLVLNLCRRVFVLDRLTDENIREILIRTLHKLAPSPPPPPGPPSEPEHPHSSQTAVADPPTSPPSPSIQAADLETPTAPPSAAHPHITEKIIKSVVSFSLGDARTALSLLELAIAASATTPETFLLSSLKKSVVSRYDRSGDDRYDMISALHKSVRGSDGSAAMYWLARYVRCTVAQGSRADAIYFTGCSLRARIPCTWLED